ncbi:uncharacterized protein [Penaeus vannamei]|uniref:uncharacterized protein n=1 Tax=Penaeus vannamei TaxID=6689 RepID=UPI00387F7C2D
MEAVVRSCIFLLFCPIVCSGHGPLLARGLSIPIEDVPRPVSLWADAGSSVSVDGPDLKYTTYYSTEARWHNFTAGRREAKFCVATETEETCSRGENWLSLRTGSEAQWYLDPLDEDSGRSQYSLRFLELDLHDSPVELFWRPGEHARTLEVKLGRSHDGSEVSTSFNRSQAVLWHDVTFQRASGEAACVVMSAVFDASSSCRGDQTKADQVFVGSRDANGRLTPSYFSFSSEDDTSVSSSLFLDWCVITAALILASIVTVVCLWKTRSPVARRTSRCDSPVLPRNVRPPPPPPPRTLKPPSSPLPSRHPGDMLAPLNAHKDCWNISINEDEGDGSIEVVIWSFRRVGGREDTPEPDDNRVGSLSSDDYENSLYEYPAICSGLRT